MFIVPRNENTLIVGGNYHQFEQTLDWNAEFYPSLKYPEVGWPAEGGRSRVGLYRTLPTTGMDPPS